MPSPHNAIYNMLFSNEFHLATCVKLCGHLTQNIAWFASFCNTIWHQLVCDMPQSLTRMRLVGHTKKA